MSYKDRNETAKCRFCGKVFIKNMYNQRLCSKKCSDEFYNKGKQKPDAECLHCGEKFLKKAVKHYFCSYDCGKEYRKIKAPTSDVWALSVEFISERDNYKCRDCGQKNSVKLVVHHINPLVYGGNNEYNNLILLCERCHSKRHADIENFLLKIKK